MGLKSLNELPDLENIEGISESGNDDILKSEDEAAMLNQLSFAVNEDSSRDL